MVSWRIFSMFNIKHSVSMNHTKVMFHKYIGSSGDQTPRTIAKRSSQIMNWIYVQYPKGKYY